MGKVSDVNRVSKFFLKRILEIFGLFLILGGLGIEVGVVQLVGLAGNVVITILLWTKKAQLSLPKFFIPYLLFLLVFIGNSMSTSVDSKVSLGVFSLFLGGGFFWLVSFNLEGKFSDRFDKLIILLGLIFGGLAVYSRYLAPETIKNWSLYAWSSGYRNHNHIGDLWALILMVAVYYSFKSPKKIVFWALIPLGFYFLLISQSRAALVSLGVGVIYLAMRESWGKKFEEVLIFLYVSLAVIFLYFGSKKSIIFSHPYFVQAILGFIHNPQGVGIANFGIISSNPENYILGLSGFSYFTHDLVLEILVGLGILGFSFIYWLYEVFLELVKVKSEIRLLYTTLFLTLFVNFLLDVTYTVPTMVWLWFMFLGLAQDS